MLLPRVLAPLVVCLITAGCRSPQEAPELPRVATDSFAPAVRAVVDPALSEARSRPNDPAAVGRLGMVLHAHGQLTAARACYRRASILAPRSFEWLYYLGVASDGAAAVEPLRAALRLRDYLPAKLELGAALLAAGQSAAAAGVYRGLSHPAALFGYGRATDDPSYYEKALAAYPNYGAAMFALAQHYRRTGRAADAARLLADYPRFMTSAPPIDDPLMRAVGALVRSPEVLIRQAADLEAKGQLAAAVDLHLQALELDPRMAQAHINLISLYARLGRPDEAEAHYRRAIEADPQAAEAYYNFGVLCYKSGRRSEAETAFEKTLAINAGHAGAHNNLGVLLQEEGKLAEAAKHFQKAIELQPGLRLARFHLGRIYANEAQYARAIEQFKRAAALDDEATPTYLYALGATQARAGNTTAAVSTLESAREKAVSRGQTALAASIARDLGRLKP